MEQWQGFLGVVIGGLIVAGSNWFLQDRQQRHAIERQKEQWAHEDQVREMERRNARGDQIAAWDNARANQQREWDSQRIQEGLRFQRETLGELQELLEELTNAALFIDHEFREIEKRATPAERQADEIATTPEFQEYRRRYRAARARVAILAVRAEDETVLDDTRNILGLTDDLAYKPPAVRRELALARREAGLEIILLHQDLDETKSRLNRRIGALLKHLYPTEK